MTKKSTESNFAPPKLVEVASSTEIENTFPASLYDTSIPLPSLISAEIRSSTRSFVKYRLVPYATSVVVFVANLTSKSESARAVV